MFDEDNLIDSLLENIDIIDKFSSSSSDNEKSSIGVTLSSISSSSPTAMMMIGRKRERFDDDNNNSDFNSDENNDDNSSSSGNSSSSPTTILKYKPIIVPRILKNDIRRKYLSMFTNVMNSYDFPLMDSFFRKFTTSDVSLYKSPCTNIGDLRAVSLSGVNLLIYYMGALLQTSPDKIIRIDEGKIKSRSDTEQTEVTAKFSMKFTRLYDITPATIASVIIEQFRSPNNEGPSATTATAPAVTIKSESQQQPKKKPKKLVASESLTTFEENRGAFYQQEDYQQFSFQFDPMNPSAIQTQFPLLPKPSPTWIEGTFTLGIDAHKRIQQISMTPVHHFFG